MHHIKSLECIFAKKEKTMHLCQQNNNNNNNKQYRVKKHSKIIASDISVAATITQHLAKNGGKKNPPRNVKFETEGREMLQHCRRIQIQPFQQHILLIYRLSHGTTLPQIKGGALTVTQALHDD